MKRSELEHVLRAAGAIAGASTWVIVGSQAILGSIGERSPFHETFGYYAHGVGPETAILPSRWRERAVAERIDARLRSIQSEI